MVEADSHLKLLHVSILDMYKELEHINKVFIGIWSQSYTDIPILGAALKNFPPQNQKNL